MKVVDRKAAARVLATLATLAKQVDSLRLLIEQPQRGGSDVPSAAPRPPRAVANRAADEIDRIREVVNQWCSYYQGYDPMFTWWVENPLSKIDESLNSYSRTIRTRADLEKEMISYTPEELIAIAEREYQFSLSEMKKASREMGFGDDWKAAMEKVKDTYVPPGEQTELIRRLGREAEEVFAKHQWITIPELAKEDWRMEMIPPDRQRVSPFFLGRRSDSGGVSDQRHDGRRLFATPFWTEGGALNWEMFQWDHDFHVSPEDRIGALFWRMHRSARIVFSLSFHLAKMSPEQAIKYLIDAVNFEPNNAECEVRRSFGGTYSPLYQAAYMLGGLQLRALHKELVDSKKMTDLQFHDAVYQGGTMPIAIGTRPACERPSHPRWRGTVEIC